MEPYFLSFELSYSANVLPPPLKFKCLTYAPAWYAAGAEDERNGYVHIR